MCSLNQLLLNSNSNVKNNSNAEKKYDANVLKFKTRNKLIDW